MEDLAGLPMARYEHRLLVARVSREPHRVRLYLALFEALGAVLLTRDEGLASVARGHVATEIPD